MQSSQQDQDTQTTNFREYKTKKRIIPARENPKPKDIPATKRYVSLLDNLELARKK